MPPKSKLTVVSVSDEVFAAKGRGGITESDEARELVEYLRKAPVGSTLGVPIAPFGKTAKQAETSIRVIANKAGLGVSVKPAAESVEHLAVRVNGAKRGYTTNG